MQPSPLRQNQNTIDWHEDKEPAAGMGNCLLNAILKQIAYLNETLKDYPLETQGRTDRAAAIFHLSNAAQELRLSGMCQR